jgi:hypothetical protein
MTAFRFDGGSALFLHDDVVASLTRAYLARSTTL